MLSLSGVYSQIDDESNEDIESNPGLFTPTNSAQRPQLFPPHFYGQHTTDSSAPAHFTPPSRHRGNMFLKRQSYPQHPYARDTSYHGPVDSGMAYQSPPGLVDGGAPYNLPPFLNDQMTALVESQKAMIKTQENVIKKCF